MSGSLRRRKTLVLLRFEVGRKRDIYVFGTFWRPVFWFERRALAIMMTSDNGVRPLGPRKKEDEWPDYYTPENIEELKLFFDRYCKDIHNGWELTPRVRIDVQDAYDELACSRRSESEFPLARTVYRKLYLDAATMSASYDAPTVEATVSYDANEGQAEFDFAFTEDTEITGYMKLHTWVEAVGHDDMDLFVTIKKIGPKHDRTKEFVIDPEAHPSHPIF